jgi:hypothetical protein
VKIEIFSRGGGVRRILIKSYRTGKYHPLPGKGKVLGTKPVAKFMVTDRTGGYIVDCGKGMSYRPASLAGRYGNPMPEKYY